MAVLYSYFDESGKFQNTKTVSFGGVIGTLDEFGTFDRHWRRCLRSAKLQCFSMKEALSAGTRWSERIPAQTINERIEAIRPFAECIKHHIDGVGVGLDVDGFNCLNKRARKFLGGIEDPHYVAFLRTMLCVVEHRPNQTGVSLICDDDEKVVATCYRLYRRLQKIHHAGRQLICLSFASDEAFVALQAADFVSSIVRLESARKFYGEPHDYGALVGYVIGNERMTGGLYGREELQSLSDKLSALPDPPPTTGGA